MKNIIEVQTNNGLCAVIAYNKQGIYIQDGTLILYPYLKALKIVQGFIPRSLQELCESWGIGVRS